jgi:hypothetical protein
LAIKIGEAKISNSHRGYRFKIEKRDIENGQPNDPCNCAAARALKRQFGAREVFVYRDVTYILKDERSALRFHTTAPLRLETIIFDRNGEFFPGEYDLAPAPLVEKASRPKGASRPAQRSGRKVRERYSIPNVRPTASQKLPRV